MNLNLGYRMLGSVRAMQYILDMAVNTKIPDDLVHLSDLELNFNARNVCRSISKFTVFPLRFWLYLYFILKFDSCLLFFLDSFIWAENHIWLSLLSCSAFHLSEQNKKDFCNLTLCSAHSTDRQSDQLKSRKFYENFSEYATFSNPSGKGHKTKGQIL